MRTFDTGATRDSNDDKLDFDGFLSPIVLEQYAKYMHSHRIQADGKLRDSDNWQKGIPQDQYMKSLWRHFFDVWAMHRGVLPDTMMARVEDGEDEANLLDEALYAVMFNVMGYLHERLVVREGEDAEKLNLDTEMPVDGDWRKPKPGAAITLAERAASARAAVFGEVAGNGFSREEMYEELTEPTEAEKVLLKANQMVEAPLGVQPPANYGNVIPGATLDGNQETD